MHRLQDYNSLFPLDDTQPSKLMRLLSSNEDEPVTLSSPGRCSQLSWSFNLSDSVVAYETISRFVDFTVFSDTNFLKLLEINI